MHPIPLPPLCVPIVQAYSGVIMRDIGDPFLSLLVRVLQNVVHEAGFEMLIGHTNYDYQTAESQLHVMASYWFDGLFLLGNVPGDDHLMQMLDQRKIPLCRSGLWCTPECSSGNCR